MNAGLKAKNIAIFSLREKIARESVKDSSIAGDEAV
jgi:hypothetical protein